MSGMRRQQRSRRTVLRRLRQLPGVGRNPAATPGTATARSGPNGATATDGITAATTIAPTGNTHTPTAGCGGSSNACACGAQPAHRRPGGYQP